MQKALIRCEGSTFEAEFLETDTTRKMFEEMPFSGKVTFWGDEIYFPIPVQAELENDAREEVEVGTLAYWPPTNAFCIFFGPTPVSTNENPRGYSAVNICGRIKDGLAKLSTLTPGAEIKVELLPDS